MADWQLVIDDEGFKERFSTTLPNLTRASIAAGMERIMGEFYFRVLGNIDEMFDKTKGYGTFMIYLVPRRKEGGVPLRDSISYSVQAKEGGNLVIGYLGFDASKTPYAAILEYGGQIPQHMIYPKTATSLAIPTATLESYTGEGDTFEEYIYRHAVDHPPVKIEAYHYIAKAAADIAKTVGNDLELAVAQAIMDSGL
jgi:hypothetical protein